MRAALNGSPELSLSRLICPRILAPNTDYIACVVPTFDLGRKAGLGIAITDSGTHRRHGPGAGMVARAAAGRAAPHGGAAGLPSLGVPHRSGRRFRIAGGAPAATAGAARARAPADRIGAPGFDLPPGLSLPATLEVEGALRPVLPTGTPDVMPPWPDNTLPAFQDELAAIVNAPGVAAELQPGADPLLAPPLYGDCYRGRRTVSATGRHRHRLARPAQPRSAPAQRRSLRHARRSRSTRRRSMASAWEQAGELQRANQRMRQLQMSMAVGNRLQARHFTPLSDEAAVRVNAPVLGRIGLSTTPGTSMLAHGQDHHRSQCGRSVRRCAASAASVARSRAAWRRRTRHARQRPGSRRWRTEAPACRCRRGSTWRPWARCPAHTRRRRRS